MRPRSPFLDPVPLPNPNAHSGESKSGRDNSKSHLIRSPKIPNLDQQDGTGPVWLHQTRIRTGDIA